MQSTFMFDLLQSSNGNLTDIYQIATSGNFPDEAVVTFLLPHRIGQVVLAFTIAKVLCSLVVASLTSPVVSPLVRVTSLMDYYLSP